MRVGRVGVLLAKDLRHSLKSYFFVFGLAAMCVDARTPHHECNLDLYREVGDAPPLLARLTKLAEAYFRQ